MGSIVIGDDVRIGPNAVVTMNIPAGSTVVAPPPRIVRLRKRPLPSGNSALASSSNENRAATE
jgi:serine acetyltransferase